jgi:SAM-dependent methyltransferase
MNDFAKMEARAMAPAGKRRQITSTDQGEAQAELPAPETEETTVPLNTVLEFLARRPDVEALRGEFPNLTADDVKAYFANARDLIQRAPTVHRRKSANQPDMVRTHGLPEPDGSLHKGNIFRALLGPFKPGKMLDLGAGKGNFSLSAAQMGWQVTAVDARSARWPDADQEADAEIADLIRSIRWIQADVRQFPIAPGDYDLICILGLLHHLEVPDQVDLVRRCAGTPLLIDTRIAPSNVDREGPYEGMVVREHGEDREERDLVLTAAWGNATSFRHTEESLLRLIRDCGFPQAMTMRPPHRRDYTFYLCLPRNAEAKPGSAGRRAKKVVGQDRGGKLWTHWTPSSENEPRDDPSGDAR